MKNKAVILDHLRNLALQLAARRNTAERNLQPANVKFWEKQTSFADLLIAALEARRLPRRDALPALITAADSLIGTTSALADHRFHPRPATIYWKEKHTQLAFLAEALKARRERLFEPLVTGR